MRFRTFEFLAFLTLHLAFVNVSLLAKTIFVVDLDRKNDTLKNERKKQFVYLN